jgi:hypothetical protein
MTDISREAVTFEVNGLRFMHNSTCKENRLPPKECATSHSRAADMILALRAALDAAVADKAQAVTDAICLACAHLTAMADLCDLMEPDATGGKTLRSAAAAILYQGDPK